MTLGFLPFCPLQLSFSTFSTFRPSIVEVETYFMTRNTQKSEKHALDSTLDDLPEAGPSRIPGDSEIGESSDHSGSEEEGDKISASSDDLAEGTDPEGFVGEKVLKPLAPEALVAFQAAQNRAGVVYISRIPPGMRPTKVRHLMSAYGDIGRVYLQQEGMLHLLLLLFNGTDHFIDAKRAYLRRKYTSTKKPHYTEGWVEFKDKKVARSVAEMLNAQPIGGKKGTRWRDDIWTMKYLPRFKWNMLTEQVGLSSLFFYVDQ